jgi:hypothetical protein
MSDEETRNLDVEAGLLRVACEQLLGEAGEVMVRPDLKIMRLSGVPVVDSGGGYVELEAVNGETAGEIIAAGNKLSKQEREDEDAGYLDPKKNPFIKVD